MIDIRLPNIILKNEEISTLSESINKLKNKAERVSIIFPNSPIYLDLNILVNEEKKLII